MTQWQPIETAPRDGTVIIMWLKEPYAQQVGIGYRPITQVIIGDLFEETVGDDCMICSPYGDWCSVTHWMPLPDPPEPTP